MFIGIRNDNMNNKLIEIAVFGGGCFWCTEAVFNRLKGVIAVTPGYAGGRTKDPTYSQVCYGDTGHAEVIKVEFDPSIISYQDLVEVFFHTHNPTTLNKQGADTGEQYRSIILYTSTEQKQVAEQVKEELDKSRIFKEPIVTEIKKLDAFYEAEVDHKEYYEKNPYNPYCMVVIAPKIQSFENKYKSLLRTS